MRSLTIFFVASLFFQVVTYRLQAQVVISPAVFSADQSITITFDANQGNAGLIGVSSVHMHAGVITSGPAEEVWTNVVGQWGNPASSGQMTGLGNNKWSITISSPRTYFNVPAGTPIYRLGMVFRESGPCGGFGGVTSECRKGATASNGDIFVDVSQGGFDIAITEPTIFPVFKNIGESITLSGESSQSAALTVAVNAIEVAAESSATSITFNHTVAETGIVTVTFSANNGSETKTKTIQYFVRNPVNQARPVGIQQGVNYNSDPTKLILCFRAPLKSSVYVVGDFNDWQIDPAYTMKKDGEYFWIELTGLTSGEEYAYQFLVDENLFVADPYCEKILDPANDQFINSAVYPQLKAYPSKATGIVAVFQTNQQPYVWQSSSYTRPEKEKLMIYELLVRDFDTEKSFQAVISRLDYLQSLGVNAIELMPIMEFSGNNSWGYNPIFYFAVDKAYGPKNKLKELIDKAHQRGIAVILDMVLNQADYEFPYVKMYWQDGKPASNSPWFNRDATHPFNVFFDFNHDSPYTEDLIDDINKYWITEYKFDGFRFDLSKGFTQTYNTDVGAWGQYDQSRVDNLTRMANEIWSIDPDAYVILEHLGVDSEESVLANNGMMLWGIMHGQYKQNAVGFASNSDISRTFYKNRSGTWNNKASVIAYMESHDEERILYESLQFGNSSGTYNIKSLPTALERIKAASAFLYTIPGPKMLWQFGEFGYDISINFNGRTGEKPILWNYLESADRTRLLKTVSSIVLIRNEYEIFGTDDVSIEGGSGLTKQIILKGQPYIATPSNAGQMNIVIVGNFDVTLKTISANFPHSGSWYHYFALGNETNVPSVPFNITLQPGEFRIYSDVKLPDPEPELQPYLPPVPPSLTSAQFDNNAVELQWVDNSNLETEFRIYRRAAGDASFNLVGTKSRNTNSHIDDDNIESLTEYEYYIEAYNIFGSSVSENVTVITDEIVTGIEDSVLKAVRLYPNPSKGIFSIQNNTGLQLTVAMFDMHGRKINTLSSGEDHYNVSGYRAGMYLIKVSVPNGSKYFRLVIQ